MDLRGFAYEGMCGTCDFWRPVRVCVTSYVSTVFLYCLVKLSVFEDVALNSRGEKNEIHVISYSALVCDLHDLLGDDLAHV